MCECSVCVCVLVCVFMLRTKWKENICMPCYVTLVATLAATAARVSLFEFFPCLMRNLHASLTWHIPNSLSSYTPYISLLLPLSHLQLINNSVGNETARDFVASSS